MSGPPVRSTVTRSAPLPTSTVTVVTPASVEGAVEDEAVVAGVAAEGELLDAGARQRAHERPAAAELARQQGWYR